MVSKITQLGFDLPNWFVCLSKFLDDPFNISVDSATGSLCGKSGPGRGKRRCKGINHLKMNMLQIVTCKQVAAAEK